MKFFFFLLGFLLLFISCEEETEIDIPRSEPQIAVSSILIPNKEIEVYIFQSIHVLDTKDIPVTNAVVTLFSGNHLQEVLEYDSAGIYRSQNIKPEKGCNYSIEVIVDGFNKITAKTSVPYSVSLDSINVDRYVGTSDNGFPLSLLNLYFTDTIKELTYYKYNCHACTDSFSLFGTLCFGGWFSYDATILEEGNKESDLFSNKLFEQSNNTLNLNYEDPASFFFSTDTVDYTVSAQILSLSEEFYKYQKSLNQYYESMDDIWGINNPPQLYSNINNGYGIFAALAYSEIVTKRILDKTE